MAVRIENIATPNGLDLLASFDRVRIINLPKRADRRRAVARELGQLGHRIDGERIAFHPANRPDDAGGFDTIGTRGCFLSHLAVLRDAERDGVASLLILEDDVAFSASEIGRMPATLHALGGCPWSIVYGGSPVDQQSEPLTVLRADQPVMLAHFIAFTRPTIQRLVPYLDAILTRPPGSPDGGPMHVDGAYSWFRQSAPELQAFAATPSIAHQRASATDIHQRRGLDRVPLLRHLLVPARALKNVRRSRD